MSILSVEELTKSFTDVKALKNFHFEVSEGEMVSLIGPDGAGKTTFLRILCGLLLPDSGEVTVLGYNPAVDMEKIKQNIGYMPQRFSLYPDLTVAENLRFFSDIYRLKRKERQERTERLLKFSRLESFSGRKAGALSGGMKQKLALSCTLIHTPKLLILDEPTTGVDPVSREEFWTILKELRAEGVTILVTTPYMDEAALCDRTALVYRGEILAEGTPDEITELYPFQLLRIYTDDPQKAAEILAEQSGYFSVELYGDRVHVGVDDLDSAQKVTRTILANKHVHFDKFEAASPSLEDTFVYLVKQSQQTTMEAAK